MTHVRSDWLSARLQRAAALCNGEPARVAAEAPPAHGSRDIAPQDIGPLWLGIDLGTCDVVSMVVDGEGRPVAVCLDWADVIRDGVVVDFFGACEIVRRHLATLERQLGHRFTHAATSFPPGTDPRLSVNVLESAGLIVTRVLDEPSAVADMLTLARAVVVDIGGGTTGIAVVRDGRVVYSGDEATGGYHISLTLAGNRRIALEEAEQMKRRRGGEIWPIVRPVYDKMADIVARHIEGHEVDELWLAGGSSMLPGVKDLFKARFAPVEVHLPPHAIFMTPLAIAISASNEPEGNDA